MDNVPHSTAVDRVVIALRKEMLEGRMVPGTQLREEMLAQRFEMSRSTIREALRVLTMDGLATRMPNRSVTVHHMTEAEVDDIFTARLVLERASVQSAATCPHAILDALEDALATYVAEVQTGDVPRAADAHVEFHATMVFLLTRSLWLGETERSLMRHLLLIIASVHTSAADLQAEIGQHRELVELCRARRVDEAQVRLEKDLMASKAFALKYAFEAQRAVKRSDRSPWQEQSPLGVSLRATAAAGGVPAR
jgi:DNA-binding GntR family transcriptional regulator